MKEKVVRAARELGLDVQVKALGERAHTVAEVAAAVGCDAPQVARVLVYVADGDPVIAVTSSAHEVDPERLADVFDCAEIRAAGSDEVRAATGLSAGGVSPIGTGLPVVIDRELLAYDCIYAPAGDGDTLFEVDPRKLADSVGARVVDVAAANGGPPA